MVSALLRCFGRVLDFFSGCFGVSTICSAYMQFSRRISQSPIIKFSWNRHGCLFTYICVHVYELQHWIWENQSLELKKVYLYSKRHTTFLNFVYYPTLQYLLVICRRRWFWKAILFFSSTPKHFWAFSHQFGETISQKNLKFWRFDRVACCILPVHKLCQGPFPTFDESFCSSHRRSILSHLKK